MAIHYPPRYRYALFDPWDRKAFEFIKNIAKKKTYPKVSGTKEDKNQFLATLIRTQKSLHDWRQFLADVLNQVKESGTIDTKTLINKYPPDSIGKEVPTWVTYEEDKIVSNFIDELERRRVDFIGADEEISEFTVRFILGQLGHDWEQTIMMIWEMLGNKNIIRVNELNKEMQNFDYLNLFES